MLNEVYEIPLTSLRSSLQVPSKKEKQYESKSSGSDRIGEWLGIKMQRNSYLEGGIAGLTLGIFCIIPLKRSLTIDSSVDAKRDLCCFRYWNDN